MIQSLGGVEFLSRLRHDLTDREHVVAVDNILNSLFWIHTEEEEREPAKPANGEIKANGFHNHHLSHELDANHQTSMYSSYNQWWKKYLPSCEAT